MENGKKKDNMTVRQMFMGLIVIVVTGVVLITIFGPETHRPVETVAAVPAVPAVSAVADGEEALRQIEADHAAALQAADLEAKLVKIASERAGLAEERERLVGYRAAFVAERAALAAERDALRSERSERDALAVQTQAPPTKQQVRIAKMAAAVHLQLSSELSPGSGQDPEKIRNLSESLTALWQAYALAK